MGPVIVPGCGGTAGVVVTANVWEELVPHELVAVTVMSPLTAVPDVDTVIEAVLAPAVILHPVGNVHVYEVAFGTAVIL